MKKVSLYLFVAFLFTVMASKVLAQPFTPTMASDSYGIAQGGDNDPTIPTPKDNNDSVPDINDAISLLLSTPYAHNSDVDKFRWTAPDETWQDLGGSLSDGDPSNYLIIGLTAMNNNTLGVYKTSDPSTHIPVVGPIFGSGFIGDGTSADPFHGRLSTLAPGTNFGWYLDTDNGVSTDTWNSDPSKNFDKLDHMLTYDLSPLTGKSFYVQYGNNPPILYTLYNPFLITWEDLRFSGGRLGDEDFDDGIYLVSRVQPVIPEPLSVVLLGSGLLGLVGTRRKKAQAPLLMRK